ncbi:tRNA A64-2'-O-ribosylphosphate transferase [Pyronema domesticum]|uniref:Similar to Uncharacterized protein C3F10.06c acc. no. Q10181 n=1 Tax=Pyronema omphalodes (strain CBS 100304) TaxID=1076935 RepID=U4LI63_PYROM|nr:tRNA A64-2'-O-ribosylphosphate transferase [Pyronema domesticum]CCX12019.1 Similar to Uncharacterized protein C3F10.06c; acc. no. Q10181 [Pyronema omphalodes CBS 100304]
MTNPADPDPEFTFTVFTPSPLDPTFHPTLPQLSNSIRRSTRTLRNRLHSISADSHFIRLVSASYHLPVIPNARAGDWYVPPSLQGGGGVCGGVYFKSTDGHTNEWSFSLRRLNLSLLSLLSSSGGAIIVDSTRRGKRFPDSLAKTIPIWIAVINSILFPEIFPKPVLYTTPLAVSANEAAAIERLLPGFVDDLKELGVQLPKLKKPLRPIFISPDSPLPEEKPSWGDFVPLVLVTASRMQKGTGGEGEYIQGAGDDHEGWAAECGLTPGVFWRFHEKIMAAQDDGELDAVIAEAVATGVEKGTEEGEVVLVRPTGGVFVAPVASVPKVKEGWVVVNCAAEPIEGATNIPIPGGKRGNKALRMAAPGLVKSLLKPLEEGKKVCFVCETGDDVAPAVALVVLCSFFRDDGTFKVQDKSDIDKNMVKRRLAWLSTARTTVNPARGLMNAVNSVLMGWED